MTNERLTYWKSALVALVIALMVFAKQIAFFLVEENRYFFFWQQSDSIALVLDVLVLAGLIWVVAMGLRRLGWAPISRVYDHLLVLVLAASILSLLPSKFLYPFEDSKRLHFIWLVVVAVVSFSLGYARSRLIKYVADLCLVFSPLVAILFLQTLTMGTWSTSGEADPKVKPVLASAVKPDPTKHPIFVFVFDEWSLNRTMENGRGLPRYANTRRLSEEAYRFSNAWSFSSRSMHSLPAIGFQLDQRIQIGSSRTYWETGGKRVPTTELPSILQLGREHGYATAVHGFYLPYQRIYGAQADYCRSRPTMPRGDGLLESMAMSAVRNLQWLPEPVTELRRQELEAKVQSEWWYDLCNWQRAETLQLLASCPPNTIAFFHWPLPHGPFVFNEDGTYHGQYPKGTLIKGLHGTVADYERHLQYHDRIIGEIIDQLKKTGQYDKALVILTSDHEWRGDPTFTEPNWKIDPLRRRVPLLVKFPGQKTGRAVERTVYNHVHLRPMIEQVLRGEVDEGSLQKLMDNLEYVPVPTGKNSVRPSA